MARYNAIINQNLQLSVIKYVVRHLNTRVQHYDVEVCRNVYGVLVQCSM